MQAPTPTKAAPPPEKASQGAVPLTATEILRRLEPLYGPLQWTPRRDAAPELVVTILSQHTSDLNAERAYEQLIQAFGSLEAVAQAEESAIAGAIRSGGLANQKAPRIKGALLHILEQRGALDLDFLAELPLQQAKAWLTALPGVGKKTAAVVLCFSFGMPAMAVDTHVHRVARRLGLIAPKTTADQAHDLLEAMVPPRDVYRFHVALITHGRQVCKAPRPLCDRCPLADGCPTGQEMLAGSTAEPASSRSRSRPL
ncbi:MAG: endonuclease III [Chloroflexi bacterium]|nr:endonuclease III [Chloroflexota bacterium]